MKYQCPTCSGTGELPTGSTMRTLRESAGVTLTALAHKMKLSPSYLSDLETGKRRFTADREKSFRRAVEKLTKH